MENASQNVLQNRWAGLPTCPHPSHPGTPGSDAYPPPTPKNINQKARPVQVAYGRTMATARVRIAPDAGHNAGKRSLYCRVASERGAARIAAFGPIEQKDSSAITNEPRNFIYQRRNRTTSLKTGPPHPNLLPIYTKKAHACMCAPVYRRGTRD